MIIRRTTGREKKNFNFNQYTKTSRQVMISCFV